MDVIRYLDNDHATVLKLLKSMLNTSSSAVKSREKKFVALKKELYLHEQVEQKVLYPALKKKDKKDILEATQEHHLVNLLLSDIESISFKDEIWIAKITVLQECLNHHIKEERSKLFPLTRKMFDMQARKAMTSEMEELKQQLKKSSR